MPVLCVPVAQNGKSATFCRACHITPYTVGTPKKCCLSGTPKNMLFRFGKKVGMSLFSGVFYIYNEKYGRAVYLSDR